MTRHIFTSSLLSLSACVAAPAMAEPSITLDSAVIHNLTYIAPDANCMPLNAMISYLMSNGFNHVDHARDRNTPSTLAVFHHEDMSASIVVVSDVDHACIIAGY